MALRVEQLSLGPMGTNCYVVRAETGAGEAAIVDPSGDATELRLTLARLGASCAGILVTHGHWDHLLGVADLAEGTGAQVYMAEGERFLLETPPGGFTPPGVSVRAYTPDVLLVGGETDRASPVSTSTCSAFPGTLRRTSRTTPTGACSPATSCSRARSGRTDFPGSDWDTLQGSLRDADGHAAA